MNDTQFFKWMQSDPERNRILKETIKVLTSDTDLGRSLREEYFQNDNEKIVNEISSVQLLESMTIEEAMGREMIHVLEKDLGLEKSKKESEERKKEERKKESKWQRREREKREREEEKEWFRIKRQLEKEEARIKAWNKKNEEKRITVTGYMGGNDLDTYRKKLYNQQVEKEMQERKILVQSLQHKIKITAPKKKKKK